MPYWYLLPLYVPTLWMAANVWHKSPAAAIVSMLVVLALYVGIAWLNVVAAVRGLRIARNRVESMFSKE